MSLRRGEPGMTCLIWHTTTKTDAVRPPPRLFLFPHTITHTAFGDEWIKSMVRRRVVGGISVGLLCCRYMKIPDTNQHSTTFFSCFANEGLTLVEFLGNFWKPPCTLWTAHSDFWQSFYGYETKGMNLVCRPDRNRFELTVTKWSWQIHDFFLLSLSFFLHDKRGMSGWATWQVSWRKDWPTKNKEAWYKKKKINKKEESK